VRPGREAAFEAALALWTRGSAWFSGEEDRKGVLSPGRRADLAVRSEDYFSVDPEEIRRIESVLTVVDGRIVYAAGPFAALDPEMPPVSPDGSPAARFGGYDNQRAPGGTGGPNAGASVHRHVPVMGADGRVWETGCGCGV
jgi:hypothetical protein